ncbi:MAG: lytic transglycosylase domain-containing protein [Bacteroidales bacterium]|nr:lytic transglycosylase domain-containing protein [Bacteroidales bacterium]
MKGSGVFLSKKVVRVVEISILALFIVLIIFLTQGNGKVSPEEKSPATALMTESPFIPELLEFCGEKVPLEFYDVFESLERELIVNTYYHSQTLLMLKRANRYFPVVEPILKEQGIPDDFKYLMVAESNMSNVVSPSGATGFWQIMKPTAQEYKLEVTDEIDERYHLEKSTVAACMFLKESYKKYTSWTLAAASYNVGRNGVDRQIERQGESYYYDLLFNEETARYVFRILAIKAVMTYPEKYNFHVADSDKYAPEPYTIDTVSQSIKDLGDYARKHDTNYKMLKYLNPWMRDKSLPVASGKMYLVKIPERREL